MAHGHFKRAMMAKISWVCLLCSMTTLNNICFARALEFISKDQAFINSLKAYEIVQPELSRISPFKYTNSVVNQEGKILSFLLSGRRITLELSPNRNLFSKNYFERYITVDGTVKTKENSHHCFYHGYVLGNKEGSTAAISTCDGVDGYFTISNNTYVIHPASSVDGEMVHIVFQPHHVNHTALRCDHNRSQIHEILPDATRPHRARRDVLTETKFLEMVIVSDKSQFDAHGSKTALRTKQFANIIDSVYRIHNLRIVLIIIEIWEKNDKITIASDDETTLDNFKNYKKNILDKNQNTKNDHAQLLTQKKFTSGVLGKASTLSICSPTSVAVVKDHSTNVYLVASTMAHELGHNLGFDHDEDFPDQTCKCGNSTKCLMASHLGSTPLLQLSTCSIESLRTTLLDNYGTCLFDQPTKHARDAECGNAFVEEGEQCDCGPKEHCELIGNNCCNYNTCHLYPQSECSDGPCCEDCKFKSKGVVCRDAVNDCDLPEYCDGKSPLCAPDSFVHNGRPCTKDGTSSICYIGVCHTYTSQCKTFWGPTSSKAHSYCYDYINTRGDKWGHCKKLPGNNFMKCNAGDVGCGKLQCKSQSKLPIIGTNRESHTIKVGSNECWSGTVYMGDDIPEPGMIQDGTKCGDNKVCSNNSCVDIDNAYEQPKCPSNCSGNGICNNHGHCHCNSGYKCPDCKEKCVGIGGSVDSGIGCDCFDPNSTVIPATFTVTVAPSTARAASTVSLPSTSTSGKGTTRPSPTTELLTSTKVAATVILATTTTTTTGLSGIPTTRLTLPPVSPTNEVTSVPMEGRITERMRTTKQIVEATTTGVFVTVTTPPSLPPVLPTNEVTSEPTEGPITEPLETTKQIVEETTHNAGDTDTTNEDDGGVSSKSASIIAAAVIVPLLIIIVAVLLIFHFREAIRTKIRTMRAPPQKPFTTVSYIDDGRRGSSSSQANLTDGTPSRPTKLNLGGPVRNAITITPDRTSAGVVRASQEKTDKHQLTPGTPTLKPARPSLPQRLLGTRNRSLPDLLETQPSWKRPAAPNKAHSFNAADKPARPRPPALRNTSDIKKGSKADVKVPKRPPSSRTGEKSNVTSDPFNRSSLREPTGKKDSDTPRPPAVATPTINQASSEPAFRPSDIKAGKSPFGPRKL